MKPSIRIGDRRYCFNNSRDLMKMVKLFAVTTPTPAQLEAHATAKGIEFEVVSSA